MASPHGEETEVLAMDETKPPVLEPSVQIESGKKKDRKTGGTKRRRLRRDKKDAKPSIFEAGGRRVGGSSSAGGLKKVGQVPSDYDFFTRTWDEEEAAELPATEERPEEEEVFHDASPGDEALEAIFTHQRKTSDVTSARQPKFFAALGVLNREATFVPATSKRKDEGEVEAVAASYDPVIDGLYVGKKCKVQPRNQRKMQNRLVASGDQGFLDSQGNVASLEDPLAEINLRPLPEQQTKLSSLLETHFYPKRELESLRLYQRSLNLDEDRSAAMMVNSSYHLTIDLQRLHFQHHQLFNKELFLAQKLREAFDHFQETEAENQVHRVGRQITALHEAIKSIRGNPQSHSEERLRMYKHQIHSSLKEREAMLKMHNELLQKSLKLWKAVKKEREVSGFTSSPVRLEIIAKPVADVAKQEAIFQREIEEEFQIRKEDFDEAYGEEIKAYRVAKKEWKKHKEARDEARKRQNRRLENEEVTDDDEELRDHDMKVLSAELLPEPQHPKNLDEANLLLELKRKSKELHGEVGDPEIFVKLHEDAALSEKSDIKKRQEISRMQAVERSKYFFQILINRKLAHTTTPYSLKGPHFLISIREKINTILLTPPSQILIQIFEKGTIKDTRIAQLEIPIPPADAVDGETYNYEDHSFKAPAMFSQSAGTLGAGRPVQVLDDLTETPYVRGNLVVSATWGRDDEGNVLAPHSEDDLLRSHLRNVDHVTLPQTARARMSSKDLAQEDPLDPENAALFSVFKSLSSGESSIISNCFRLEQPLCNDDPLDNPRFRVLQLRDAGVPRFRGLHMIPNHLEMWSKDPAAEALRAYDKRQQLGESFRASLHYNRTYGGSGRLREHESRLKALKRGLQDWIHNRLEAAQSRKTLSDVVIEESVPDISVMGKKLLHIFAPYRPLRPERVERKKLNIQHSTIPEIKLVVTILKANNVPIRIEKQLEANVRKLTSTTMVMPQDEDEVLVNPFVEVMFDRQGARTVTAEGSLPTWNQQIELPFLGSWDAFNETNDTIFLNLFDEISLDVLEDNRDRENTVHTRFVRQWLGSLKIPVSTLLCNPKVEGSFRVDTPSVILGYDWEGKERLPTHLSLFMTTDPPVYVPEATIVEKLPTVESPSLISAAIHWKESYMQRFPKRKVECLVMDVNCHAVFVTRYIRPLAPPEDIEADEVAVARFVSLIPYVPDANLGQTNCDIWTNCEQFTTMLGGDEEEHAVLLINLLLHIGVKAWLLVGEDRGGRTATFVCTYEKTGEHFVWLPLTGEKLSINDPFLPVSQIWFAVNQENVWINVRKDGPDRTALPPLDFHNSTHWEPFFGKHHPVVDLESVQPSQLDYLPRDFKLAEELQRTIETTLKEHFMNWRKRHRTSWNRHCTALLRSLLQQMEKSPDTARVDDHVSYLREIFIGYRVIGFPLNFSYQSIEQLLEAVHATNLHSHEGRDVEFSIAVHVHPYPCGVQSVWIYVVCLRLRE